MQPDQEGLIDENDGFNDFRCKASDVIQDVAFIVGSDNCFEQMFNKLQEPGCTWESTESGLFIMQNVAMNVISEGNQVIPLVVERILNLPETTHVAVRFTSIMLLGELCDWIENDTHTFQAVLKLVLYSLQQKNGLASAAATALASICTSCQQKMVYHISGLMEIAKNLNSLEISNKRAIGLLKGISLTLTILPKDQIQSAIRGHIEEEYIFIKHSLVICTVHMPS